MATPLLVVVAVIDTGVAQQHPALKDNLYTVNGVVKGYDFANLKLVCIVDLILKTSSSKSSNHSLHFFCGPSLPLAGGRPYHHDLNIFLSDLLLHVPFEHLHDHLLSLSETHV